MCVCVFRYKQMVGDKALQLSPLTLNISSIIAEYTVHNGVTFATPRPRSARTHVAAAAAATASS